MPESNQRSFANRGYIALSQLLAMVSYNMYFSWRDRKADSAVIVYQMGKVGSSTVTETLKSLPLNMPVYQVHHLTEEGKRIEEHKASISHRPSLRRTAHWSGRYLRCQIAAQDSHKKNWFVVTLTRDPVARNISGFFHSMRLYHPDLYTALDTDQNETYFPVLKKTFLREYPHDKPLKWFDTEMKVVFDINLYEEPFPWAKGYDVIERDNVRLLIMRLENLQSSIDSAFEEWLGMTLTPFKIVSANRASEKNYQRTYSAFKDWLTLPTSYLDYMYRSEYARHYYSNAELQQFRQKWQDLER